MKVLETCKRNKKSTVNFLIGMFEAFAHVDRKSNI